MFAKLIKHEWKSISPLLTILSICALGAGLLGAGAYRFMEYSSEQLLTSDAYLIPSLLTGMALGGICLVLVAYYVSVQIILYFRFYKSRFTDEGYLTFTLPVTAGNIFWSSYLVTLIWIVISNLLTILSFFLIPYLGTLGTEEQLTFQGFKDFFALIKILYEDGAGVNLIVLLISTVISMLTTIVFCMNAITIGSILAKKHKLLAALGIYVGANAAMNAVSSIFTGFAFIVSLGMGSESFINFIYVVQLIFVAAFAAGAFCLDIHLMKNKLNLP